MEAELVEIKKFLELSPPFDELEETTLNQISHQVEIAYFRSGSDIIQLDENIHDLYVIRSGVVEVSRRNGALYNRIDEGDMFGQMGLLSNNKVKFPAKAIEDTLVYCIPESVFQNLYDNDEKFASFVETEKDVRLKQAVKETKEQNILTSSKVTTLITNAPNFIDKNRSIEQAAIQMSDELSSYLLVTHSEESGYPLLGMVTERDLCTKVLAKGLSPSLPITTIMCDELIHIDHNAYVHEAMLIMLRNNISHLPILKGEYPIGVLSVSDIVHNESQNSLLLVNSIFQQTTIDDLATLSEQVKDCFYRLVNEDANSHMIGSAMSVIGRSFKQRLIELAEETLGSPPIPYCFLALGSMGRDEQLIVTDQDNAIILDNSYNASIHESYFEKLAQFVCDGLAKCGYSYCTGGIMATSSMWRMTQNEWEQCFEDWIDNPNPKALLNASIFFDLDGVYGRLKWAEQLNAFIVRKSRKSPKFLACLARNSLNRTPPLGFFKGFVMEKDGRHNNSINLKRRGTAPLVDLIRVHALAVGSRAQNSLERLDDIIEANILPSGRGQDLKNALEFISMVRIRHQAIDIENRIIPDNNIEPENLSDFERRTLKDAFQVLSNAQNFIKFRYQAVN
ncbi:DUF294 nucleotidyltransferase-like domain-containing protein [Parashewanella tropica]|uniref:DUF294 nucleotidyltransferase-like domain-containing protein n=1 Tax=Parashewanella tropica TaxID=2547970 RepID=UPI0010595205|nr:DUF294 nucleotidyltransferase-like domain-containing protein [Parashewanella tropica]